jgi:hypothetical protein
MEYRNEVIGSDTPMDEDCAYIHSGVDPLLQLLDEDHEAQPEGCLAI